MRKLISFGLSSLILGLIYWQIDTNAIGASIKETSLRILGISLLLLVPIYACQAIRLIKLADDTKTFVFSEVIKLILAAGVLNLVLPSKLGDLTKAYWMANNSERSLPYSIGLVLLERISDLLGLCVWGFLGFFLLAERTPLTLVCGLASLTGSLILGAALFWEKPTRSALNLIIHFAPRWSLQSINRFSDSWSTLHHNLRTKRHQMTTTVMLSIFIWALHLVQIYGFALALQPELPILPTIPLNAYAILVGLLPLTLAGIGTRDGALILLYTSYLSSSQAAALGVFCTLRYVIPALAGLPYFHKFVNRARS